MKNFVCVQNENEFIEHDKDVLDLWDFTNGTKIASLDYAMITQKSVRLRFVLNGLNY